MFIRRQVGNLRRVMRAIDQCPSFGTRVVLLGNAVKRTLEFEAVYRESPDGRYRRNPSRRAALVRPVALRG